MMKLNVDFSELHKAVEMMAPEPTARDLPNFAAFRHEYIETLKALLECKAPTYRDRIDSPESNALANRLVDLEEMQPDWVERIEDQLAREHALQH